MVPSVTASLRGTTVSRHLDSSGWSDRDSHPRRGFARVGKSLAMCTASRTRMEASAISSTTGWTPTSSSAWICGGCVHGGVCSSEPGIPEGLPGRLGLDRCGRPRTRSSMLSSRSMCRSMGPKKVPATIRARRDALIGWVATGVPASRFLDIVSEDFGQLQLGHPGRGRQRCRQAGAFDTRARSRTDRPDPRVAAIVDH